MKITLYSDLHLEFGTDFMPTHDTDLLILAGDIITFKNFEPLEKFLTGFTKPVLYVSGNHEYYTKQDMEVGDTKFFEWAHTFPVPVIHLKNQSVEIDGVNFFGGTMWTDFRKSNYMDMMVAHRKMNDYVMIKKGTRNLRPEDTIKMHEEWVLKLTEWLEKDLVGPRVVISHHAPVVNPNSFFRGSDTEPAYNSLDMIPLITKYKPTLWVFGHTHEVTDQIIGETRVVSNCRGYPLRNGGSECREFNPEIKLIV